ncbi:zinc finger protein 516-like [Thalassophryne amazonica]|uniref:zinc finger protein 516-like n=1 Tax=Thalassophryne amazonica TaxID=390379 RepID=UPI001471FA3B|nr:zinc finger protein 516-like [Thalassophryne amazonica]
METEEKKNVSQKCTDKTDTEMEEDVTSGHTCGVCSRTFPLLSSLSQHMRRHTREKPYKCPYCEHRAAQKGSLKVHIRNHKLGLVSPNPSGEERAGDKGQKDNVMILKFPEIACTPEKAHSINGKVKKEGTKKKVEGKVAAQNMEGSDGTDVGPHSCHFCGQVFPQVLLLKMHIKRHRNSQGYSCRMCGRRFRQAWFLQSHMHIHQVKGQLCCGKNNKLPATINGVPQDPTSLVNAECLYQLCASCGNFFQDFKNLRLHEKLHKLNQNRTQMRSLVKDIEVSKTPVTKEHFLESLNIRAVGSVGSRDAPEEKDVGRRIAQLDPICSYQAWQLATRGRLVEATEKCLGWEERLADAEVAYDTEKGEYIPLKQERKRKQNDNSNSNVKKKKYDKSLVPSNIQAHTKGGNNRICQSERIILNGLGHAFYEALHSKVKDVCSSPQQTNSISKRDQEDKKPYLCEHCDFQTVDASLLRSHMHKQHQDGPNLYSKKNASLNSHTQGRSKAARYMEYLKNRSGLLRKPYWTTYTIPSGMVSELNIKIEKSNDNEVEMQGSPTSDLLNLSVLPASERGEGSVSKTESLVKQQCQYCSHATNYPEVLWIHQRVAHRVDGTSSLAPKWAPGTNFFKSSKTGATQWRSTGPPPFLEGKDCPALPAPRSQRTQPPDFTPHSSSTSKTPTLKTQPGVTKSKHSTRCSDGTKSSRRVGPLSQKKSGEQVLAVEGGSKSSSTQESPSSSIPHFQKTCSPKHRVHRGAAEGSFPQEGLGFMLTRNCSGTSSSATADRLQACRQTCDSPSGPKGPDLWTAMNMWGLHGGKALFEPFLYSQENSKPSGEIPMDSNVLNFLKNYSSHDVASLYQYWRFVDPRFDPQVMLQLNGHLGNEVPSSSDTSKQVTSNSKSS